MDCPRCDDVMKPHRKRIPSRGPFRTSESQEILLWCSGCKITVASEDARQYLGLEVVAATGWRPIERWREKLKSTCPRGCETRMYRVCARHEDDEVLYELCPACELIIFDDGGYESLAEILAAALAAPKLRKPKPTPSLIDSLRPKKKKKR